MAETEKYGFSRSDWTAAKVEARAAMIDRAKLLGMIAYSDLVKQIRSIKVDAHDSRLFHLLGEIFLKKTRQAVAC